MSDPMARHPIKIHTMRDPETGLPRRVVDADAHLHMVQTALRLRTELTRLRAEIGLAVNQRHDFQMMTTVLSELRKRLTECEGALWRFSEGKAAYFEDHPDAAPSESMRGFRARGW